MATRHQAREAVIGLLYAYDLGNPEIKKFAEDILEEKKIRNKQREFALALFKGTVEHLDTIDEMIKKHLESWDMERVGHIERAILRLGVYELFYTDLDPAIVINEAVELAKKLGTDQSPKFINGVLDAIAKEVKNGSQKA
ncbi:transcription antitermination factor NusB [Nitratiruptor sp. SB155-2]|uniref:Transcription antitermination protein NusB n=1 Tax=Nitratiruptor sp. (strain SB155-2) TaxID=387092 RepID=NUSB_NITSB|nr:transcription antitermination factor NusB [Nitratiruptor sp. SB155-2]A6Q4Q9.1 RecName: Full=Transcription antitermination protein NusB; AltName: Full=Antitermination factor NusB [Nitratiruptor sp. SB155-2]BAF70468.1 transcription antitermination factor NusB [Nitratiruptor sp. SB155-2]